MQAKDWVNQARRAAGLSQRELAERSGVPQSAIARIEGGRQVPRVDTLQRLLKACGFEVRLTPRLTDGVDRSQLREYLALAPTERVERAVGWGRTLETVARARRRVGA